ncbi:hypothetical protein B0H14DRAFT_3170200 [Mycena olivaceomarginata]|nr:hypothetical protein B0H14DRAFT_3170200 [Mycena olivaceomarginata]
MGAQSVVWARKDKETLVFLLVMPPIRGHVCISGLGPLEARVVRTRAYAHMHTRLISAHLISARFSATSPSSRRRTRAQDRGPTSSGSAYSASASSASPDPPSPAALPDTVSEVPSSPMPEHEIQGVEDQTQYEREQEQEGPPLLTCTFCPRELIRRVVRVVGTERSSRVRVGCGRLRLRTWFRVEIRVRAYWASHPLVLRFLFRRDLVFVRWCLWPGRVRRVCGLADLGAEWWGGPVVLQSDVDVCACGLDFGLGFGSGFVCRVLGVAPYLMLRFLFRTNPPLPPSAPPAPQRRAARAQWGRREERGEENEEEEEEEEWEFRPARVPDGISLRNFGIQVPIYATLSNIVLYSPRGLVSGALQELTKRFVARWSVRGRNGVRGWAVPEVMMRMFPGGERQRRWHNGNLIANPALHPGSVEIGGRGGAGPSDAPVAVPIDPDADATRAPNTVDFGQRERDEMRELTRGERDSERFPACRRDADTTDGEGEREDLATTTASHWRPLVGQVFLGNSGDVPLGGDGADGIDGQGHDDPFMYEGTNDPRDGFGYDVCVECHEMAPFPSLAHLRVAEDHLGLLERMWEERVRALGGESETPGAAATERDRGDPPAVPQRAGEHGADDERTAARHCVPRAVSASRTAAEPWS